MGQEAREEHVGEGGTGGWKKEIEVERESTGRWEGKRLVLRHTSEGTRASGERGRLGKTREWANESPWLRFRSHAGEGDVP